MKNRTFNIENDLKMEVHNFFQSKTNGFYKNGITKLLNGWEKVIECEVFDEKIHLILYYKSLISFIKIGKDFFFWAPNKYTCLNVTNMLYLGMTVSCP